MRKAALLMLGLLLCTQVQAQDAPAYHLRTPSAAEYVQRIGEIAEQQNAQPQDAWQTSNLYSNLTDALFSRFPDLSTLDYQQLLATYDTMGIGHDGAFWRRGQWVEAIFAAWLRLKQPDLSARSELAFADFRIGVTPRDFDGDGQAEYVLDVIKGEPTDRYSCRYQAEYVNYRVVQSTGSGYQLIDTPLYWEGYGTEAGSNFGEGGQVEYSFDDINADGLPEWSVLTGGETGGGPGMGYENVGRLYILGWRDGRMVDLAALADRREYPYSVTAYGEDAGVCHGPVPRDVTWEFSNLDADPAQEILQHQVYLDNWQCLARRTRILDWDAAQDRYVQIDERRDFAVDSQNCARRQAEEAMWASEYEQALENYERALSLPPYIDPDEALYESIRGSAQRRRLTYGQYHMARMALAYQMTGQPEAAHAILDSLREQAFTYEPVRYLVEAVAAAPDTPMGACLAAYANFATHFKPDRDQYRLGVIEEQQFDTIVAYSPARVGCDVAAMIDAEVETRPFTADRLPEDYLRDLGMSVRKFIRADLNGDGQDEWLVWPETMLNPFFFAPDATGHYEVSTPAVDPFDHADEIHLWPLPDDAGIAVAYVTSRDERSFPEPWACLYDWTCGYGYGGDKECSPAGYSALIMWRMMGQELRLMQPDLDLCGTDFAALFAGGVSTAIDGGTYIWAHGHSTPISYAWDSDRKTFVRFPASPAVPTPIPTPEPKYTSLYQALNGGDYAAALPMLDDAIAYEQSADLERPEVLSAYRFQRAFILETLGRPDEALAEYVAIYTAAPDSAWGMMAALHLEPVSP